ncbi:integral membrane protein 2C-like [Ptychodera flava]|uniref:integral membrane protein 2C-like n=1 Tax=Ptychodera flava TaxID=63121 RepID=UPI003969D65B
MVKPTSIPPDNGKKDEDLKKAKEVELPPIVTVDLAEVTTQPTAPPPRQQRPSKGRRCCLTVTFILLVLAALAVGGWLLLQHYGGNTFKCGLKYREPHRGGHRGSSSSENSEEHDMKEELDIDPEKLYERIEQPENDQCERITIMHDYNINVQLSAYRMWSSGRCYVKKLNQTTSLNPREFWEKLRDPAFFDQHFQTLVETYRVVLPPLDHFGGLGTYIPLLCRGVPTYWLEKVPEDLLDSWLDEEEEILDMVEEYIDEVMEEVDEMMDDVFDGDENPLGDLRKRRAAKTSDIVDNVINWTGKTFIDMAVVKPEATKALQKMGKLQLKLPEKTF